MQHFLHNIPPHNIIHFLWFISSTTLFTTSFIYFLHNSPLHNITYLFPPQQPPTQHHLFPVIYFPPQHYSQHHLHKLFISYAALFISYASFFSVHNIIYFPIIKVNFRTVSTSQCAVFLPANTVTIAHSLNPDSDQGRYL